MDTDKQHVNTIDSEHDQIESEPVDKESDFSILTLLKSYKSVAGDSTKLVLADARLAVTSTIQILVLALVAFFLLLCIWLLILAALGVWLHGIGLSPLTLIGVFIVLHVVALAFIVLATRSTAGGLNFSATRELIPRSK